MANGDPGSYTAYATACKDLAEALMNRTPTTEASEELLMNLASMMLEASSQALDDAFDQLYASYPALKTDMQKFIDSMDERAAQIKAEEDQIRCAVQTVHDASEIVSQVSAAQWAQVVTTVGEALPRAEACS